MVDREQIARKRLLNDSDSCRIGAEIIGAVIDYFDGRGSLDKMARLSKEWKAAETKSTSWSMN